MAETTGVPSDALRALVRTTYEFAWGVVRDGGPLSPFAFAQEDGQEPHALAYMGEAPDEALTHARKNLTELAGLARASLCWDAYLTVEGERTDAMMVEAYEAGDAHGHLWGYRYRPQDGAASASPIGTMMYLENTRPPLF